LTVVDPIEIFILHCRLLEYCINTFSVSSMPTWRSSWFRLEVTPLLAGGLRPDDFDLTATYQIIIVVLWIVKAGGVAVYASLFGLHSDIFVHFTDFVYVFTKQTLKPARPLGGHQEVQ